MKVLGRNGLRDAVGGYGTLPTNEAKIQEAGGSLRHRSICSNRFAFIIRVTSENCNAVPVAGLNSCVLSDRPRLMVSQSIFIG